MGPARKRRFQRIDDKIKAAYVQKMQRIQKMRHKIGLEQKSPSNSLNSPANLKSSPIRLRTSRSPKANPFNIAITFKTTSQNNSEREFRVLQISKSKMKQEKLKKLWPKLICSIENAPLTSTDTMFNGVTLSDPFDLTSPPSTPPPSSSPRVPITAPQASFSPSTSYIINNNVMPPPNSIQHSDELLKPKMRRVVLSNRPPPICKAPSRSGDAYKFNTKNVPDLRRKITRNYPDIDSSGLRKPEDDCISIFAQTDIVTDEDSRFDVDRGSPEQLISPTKQADILNWVSQSSSSISTDSASQLSVPSPELFATEKYDFIPKPSTSAQPKISHRFDRFQSTNDSSNDTKQSSDSTKMAAVVQDDQPSFKVPFSVSVKSAKANSPIYSSPKVDSLRSNSDFPSPLSDYDSSDNNSSHVPRSPKVVFKSLKPFPQQIVRINPWIEQPLNIIISSNSAPSPLKQTVPTSPDVLLKRSPSVDMADQRLESSTLETPSVRHQTLPLMRSEFMSNQQQNSPTQNQIAFERFQQENGHFQNAPNQHLTAFDRQNEFKPLQRPLEIIERPPPNLVPRLFGPAPMRGPFQNQIARPPPPNPSPHKLGGYRHMKPNSNGFRPQMRSVIPINMPPNFVPEFNPHTPPPLVGEAPNWRSEDMIYKLKVVQEFLKNICNYHYKSKNCKYGNGCKYFHKCSDQIMQFVSVLDPEKLRELAKKIYQDKKYRLISELLGSFLRAFVSCKNITAILELVRPILDFDDAARCNDLQTILNALCQLNLKYKDAILKVLFYTGASNTKLVDILFAFVTDCCDFTSPHSTISFNWPAIEQLFDVATELDHGVFSDLCAKCLQQEREDLTEILILIGQMLLAEPCKVDVTRMGRNLLAQLSGKLAEIGGEGGRVGGLISRRWLAGNALMHQDDRLMFLDDSQLPAISSSITGPSNPNFNAVCMPRPSKMSSAQINPQTTSRNTERIKNSCSPDSSSFAATPIHHPNMSVPPLPPNSPFHPPLNHSMHPPMSAHLNDRDNPPSPTSPPPSITPPTTNSELTNNQSLYTCIMKYQHNSAVEILAKDGNDAIEPICQMLHNKTIPSNVAYNFFDVLWDHIGEHLIQYIDLKRIVLDVLFEIYEYLIKERFLTEACLLLSTKFKTEKERFLNYSAFSPSGQCSPMQKCHKAIKLLLQEKLLQSAFDWFVLEEYQILSLPSDMNNEILLADKSKLLREFLQLSYRDLNIAYNLVIFCMNRNPSDFKDQYNCILLNMINSTDHKQTVLKMQNSLFNDEYAYLTSLTLRSYVVEFFNHLNLDELIHIYERISRDHVYPNLTGHEPRITMRDTLQEIEIMFILMYFLHQIRQNRIEVTWNVLIRFQNGQDGHVGSLYYPRNLLMYGSAADSVKRLVNVLKSCAFVQPKMAMDRKWRACHTSGTVTLISDYVQVMANNYKGTQTFL